MRLHRSALLTCLAVAACLGAAPARAEEFCVATAAGLQAALDAAEVNGEGDLIRLERGTYAGSFSAVYHERFSLAVEGGYGPGCLERSADPSLTVLDAGGSGTPLRLSSLLYPEVAVSVDGLTVTNGSLSGMVVLGGTVTVRNCRSLGNRAPGRGGGIYLDSNELVRLDGCTVSGNLTESSDYLDPDGGAVYAGPAASVEVTGSVFEGNGAPAKGTGAALFVNNAGAVLVEGNRFSDNRAQYVGGVYLHECTDPVVRGNRFEENHGGDAGGLHTFFNRPGSVVLAGNRFVGNTGLIGGGARIETPALRGTVVVDGNVFDGNRAQYAGGGLAVDGAGYGADYETVTLTNNVFAGNEAGDGAGAGYGGGLRVDAIEPVRLANNTFVGNAAERSGGGAFVRSEYVSGDVDAWNNVFWLNEAPAGADLDVDNEFRYFDVLTWCPVEVSHNDIAPGGLRVAQPGFVPSGTNLPGVDPRFVDPAAGDYRLAADSPCRDAGSADAPGLPAADAAGNPRVAGEAVDLGAFEAEPGTEVVFDDGFLHPGAALDPEWRVVSGAWKLDGAGAIRSSTTAKSRADLTGVTLGAGSVEVVFRLTRKGASAPNLKLLFAVAGGGHRWVGVTATSVSLGRTVALPGVAAAVGAPASVTVGAWHTLRLDLGADGRASVFLDGAAEPVVARDFDAPATGGLAVQTKGCRAALDRFTVTRHP